MVQKVHPKGPRVLPPKCDFQKMVWGGVFRPYLKRSLIEHTWLCNSWVPCAVQMLVYNMTALSYIIQNMLISAKSKFGNSVLLKYLRFNVGLVGLSNEWLKMADQKKNISNIICFCTNCQLQTKWAIKDMHGMVHMLV